MGNKYRQGSFGDGRSKVPDVLSNYYIRAKYVKVIGQDGNFLGEMPFKIALSKAHDLDLDLIQVGGGDVPTCKIGDLSKFLYERKKKEKERQRQIRESTFETKQVIIHLTIDENDLSRKIMEVEKFLNLGHNVKFSLQMRGREISMQKDAFKLVERCVSKLSGVGSVDVPAKLNGKSIDVTFRKCK